MSQYNYITTYTFVLWVFVPSFLLPFFPSFLLSFLLSFFPSFILKKEGKAYINKKGGKKKRSEINLNQYIHLYRYEYIT